MDLLPLYLMWFVRFHNCELSLVWHNIGLGELLFIVLHSDTLYVYMFICHSFCSSRNRCLGTTMGGDLAPSLGGRQEIISRTIIMFQWISILTSKIYDDLLAIDSILSVVSLSLLSKILYITLWSLYDYLLTKNLDFRTKNSSLRPFLVSSYFASHPKTVLLKI